MNFLALSGSLRAASTNTELLRAFERHAPKACSVQLYQEMAALPLFSPDLEASTPESVLHLAQQVAHCDGLLIAAPEYAHGIPGALKNTLDWLVSRFEILASP
jgi:chromate reductase, NAD(P)H dehydrogenase (quinone)